MDPTTLIVSALVAGLADVARDIVKDSYTLFKRQLEKKIKGNKDAQHALKEVEKKPESEGRKKTLEEELTALKVGEDEELLSLAKSIMEQLDQDGAKTGKYNVRVYDRGQIGIVGDHGHVVMGGPSDDEDK